MVSRMMSRNSMVESFLRSSLRNSLMLVTRERTDLMPLDLILDGLTLSALTTLERSALKSRVPWENMRFFAVYWALPEILAPSTRMSLRPLSSAVTPRRARAAMTGLVNFLKFCIFFSDLFVMKEKLRLPRSWYTVPPPERRRTT